MTTLINSNVINTNAFDYDLDKYQYHNVFHEGNAPKLGPERTETAPKRASITPNATPGDSRASPKTQK